MNRVRVEQDLVGGRRSGGVRGVVAARIGRHTPGDLGGADVPHAARIVGLQRRRAVVGGVDDPGRPRREPREEERPGRLVDLERQRPVDAVVRGSHQVQVGRLRLLRTVPVVDRALRDEAHRIVVVPNG